MTDLKRLKELLNSWDVPYQLDLSKEGTGVTVGNDTGPNTETDRVTGYSGFVTYFEFDPNGIFLRMGAWE